MAFKGVLYEKAQHQPGYLRLSEVYIRLQFFCCRPALRDHVYLSMLLFLKPGVILAGDAANIIPHNGLPAGEFGQMRRPVVDNVL
jgi:hypothetical protein